MTSHKSIAEISNRISNAISRPIRIVRPTPLMLLVLLFGVLLLPVQPARAQPPDDRDARMQWWSEARFGMFIHWDDDHQWKSSQTLIRMLIDCAGKGGNFLLNIGPKADGSLPDIAIDNLTAIGRWMQDYGESIHGTQAAPFPGLFPWGRCTMKPLPDGNTRLYLHVFDWPLDRRLVIAGLDDDVLQACLLDGVQRIALDVHEGENEVSLTLPNAVPSEYASVILLDVVG